MSEQTKKSFDLRLSEILVLKFSQFDLEKEFNKNVEPWVEFHTNFQFKVLKEKSSTSCLITLEMKILETEEEFAELKIETVFNVNPFDTIVEKDGNFQIPDILMMNMASVSVSTMRGVLHEKLKGTIAQHEVYPLINLAPIFAPKQKG